MIRCHSLPFWTHSGFLSPAQGHLGLQPVGRLYATYGTTPGIAIRLAAAGQVPYHWMIRSDHQFVWTNDFLCIEACKLTVVDNPPVTGHRSIGFKRLYHEINEGTVKFRPSFFVANHAMGIVQASLTMNAILRSIELNLPKSKWSPFEQATTRQIRQLRQHLLSVITIR
ncbi:MAG: hypothetical protein BYD32DRAFT_432163 [Podila humilis]|nr:MAG: hypothetical protein BYD32DRAFT_432163 [Podila humilis]